MKTPFGQPFGWLGSGSRFKVIVVCLVALAALLAINPGLPQQTYGTDTAYHYSGQVVGAEAGGNADDPVSISSVAVSTTPCNNGAVKFATDLGGGFHWKAVYTPNKCITPNTKMNIFFTSNDVPPTHIQFFLENNGNFSGSGDAVPCQQAPKNSGEGGAASHCAVGGITELPDEQLVAAVAAANSPGFSTSAAAGSAAGVAFVLTGVAWYARRRWLR